MARSYRRGLDGRGHVLDHLVQAVHGVLVDVERVVELHEHLVASNLSRGLLVCPRRKHN